MVEVGTSDVTVSLALLTEVGKRWNRVDDSKTLLTLANRPLRTMKWVAG